MAYKWLKENITVQRLADGASIPNDARNTDWREFQNWLALGNTPEPEDIPSPNSANAIASADRARALKLEDLERRMSLGAPQEEINLALIDLLKE